MMAPSATSTDFSRGDRSAQNCSKLSMSASARRQASRTVGFEAQVQSLLNRLCPQRVLQARVVGGAGLELDLQRAVAKLETCDASQRSRRQQLRQLRIEHRKILR